MSHTQKHKALTPILSWLYNAVTKQSMELAIVGLRNSGKSTFVNACMGHSDRPTFPTVGFNMVKTIKDNVAIKIWDIGDGPRFRTMWPRYCAGVEAIVFVVDAADHANLSTAKRELATLTSNLLLSHIPLMVLGNKKDLPGSLDAKDLIDELDLEAISDRRLCCFVISARNNYNVQNVLDWVIALMKEQ